MRRNVYNFKRRNDSLSLFLFFFIANQFNDHEEEEKKKEREYQEQRGDYSCWNNTCDTWLKSNRQTKVSINRLV